MPTRKSATENLPDRRRVASLLSAVRERMLIDPVAFSADGRTFGYEAPLDSDLQVAGWVTIQAADGTRYLGQVVSEDITIREGPQINLDVAHSGNDPRDHLISQAGVRVRVRISSGTGILLARHEGRSLVPPAATNSFEEASIEPASGAVVARYLNAMSGARVRLPVGTVQRCDDAPPAYLRADGFDRHTFFCGQSGSGKTYSLGVVLEQLLLQTSIPLVILDPNSDFVRLREAREGVPAARAKEYRGRTRDLVAMRPAGVATSDETTLRARFSDLAEAEQAAALRLDPLADREEYAALAAIGEALSPEKYSLDEVLERARSAGDPASQQLVLRIQNLGVQRWPVWAHAGEQTTAERLSDDTRGLVLDIGALASETEKSAVAAAVLGGLWRNRERRRAMLIVIDEAHNVCPAEPSNALQANATQYCINIAAEGRKFGLYLLLSTQRPGKVHPQVLSQCDNLVLMRMNSRADIADLASAFSFVPSTLLDEATRFRQGEALLAGKIVPTPLMAKFGARLSQEGGSDVPPTWAATSRKR